MRRRKSQREKEVMALLVKLRGDLMNLQNELNGTPLRLIYERRDIREAIAKKEFVIRMLQNELQTLEPGS